MLSSISNIYGSISAGICHLLLSAINYTLVSTFDVDVKWTATAKKLIGMNTKNMDNQFVDVFNALKCKDYKSGYSTHQQS